MDKNKPTINNMFRFYGWDRGTGATTSMVWHAAKEATMNPDSNVFLVFPNQLVIEHARYMFPYSIPPNMRFATISSCTNGVYGKVYIDGSLRKTQYNADHLHRWSCVNSRGY